MHTGALAHTPTAGEIQECRGASTTQNTPPTSMISVSHLEPGPHQCCFIASHKRLVVWWPGEGILCWHISMTSFSSNQPNVCAKVTFDTLSRGFCQLVQSCLHCPMSDFSWSSVWAPSLPRSCVWVIPSQGNKLETHMYQASLTTTPW